MLPFVLTSPNQPNNNPVGHEFLGANGEILHIWNNYTTDDLHFLGDQGDDYYINLTSGIQLANAMNASGDVQWWAKNVFCGAAKINDEWQYYCTDTLPFQWNIDSDNATFVNVSGSRNVSFSGKTVEFYLTYHLERTDEMLTVTPRMVNRGDDISVPMAFGWHIRNIQIRMNASQNYLRILEDDHLDDGIPADILLSQSPLDLTYVNLDATWLSLWKYGFDTPTGYETLDMQWRNGTDTILAVRNATGQVNAPVTLIMKVGDSLPAGADRSTKILWKDRVVTCDPGITGPLSVQMNLTVNETAAGGRKKVNESATELDQVNFSIRWFKKPLEPAGRCNLYWDEAVFDDSGYSQIDYPYWDGGHQWSETQAISYCADAYGTPCGQNMMANNSPSVSAPRWYNLTFSCGGMHSYGSAQGAHLSAWTGGISTVENFSCYDRRIPRILSFLPANNTITNATTQIFTVNVSDDTMLQSVSIYINGIFNQSIDYPTINGLLYNTTTEFSATFPVDGIYNWSIRVNDTNYLEQHNMSLNWTLVVEHIVTDEAEARSAVDEGITNTIPDATIFTDRQLYTVNQAGVQEAGRFDKVALLSSQRWFFNYKTGSETLTGMSGIPTVVNVWENQSLTYSQIVQQVESLISQTVVS